jgi:hypothetical protein
MDIFVGLGIGALFAFLFAVIIGGFFMWIAAKIARVERSSFGRAMLAAIGTSLVLFIMTLITSFIPILGNAVGFIVGLLLQIFVIKGAFDTSTGKAVLVWVFNIVASIVAVLLASAIGFGTLGMLALC